VMFLAHDAAGLQELFQRVRHDLQELRGVYGFGQGRQTLLDAG
jgi:hypothetical protein